MAASNAVFEQEYERLRQESRAKAEQEAVRRTAAEAARVAYEESAKKKEQAKTKPKSHGKLLVYLALAFVVCFFVINRYVAVYESNDIAAQAKKEYEEAQQASDQVKAKIDKATDIKILEQTARERLGMSRPESHQIFYVDMQMKNHGERVGERATARAEVPVSGVAGIIISAFMVAEE